MTNEFIQWLVGQSGMVAIAAFALWQLKTSYEDRLRAEQSSADAHREDKGILLSALRDNTAAMTKLCSEIQYIRDARTE